MSAMEKPRGSWLPDFLKPREKKVLKAIPQGVLDYDLLAEEVNRKYPRILAHLGK